MAKLIVDEAALQLAMKRLAGSPIFASPDGNLLEPGVIDLLNDDDVGDRWQPGDRRTKLLALGTEACRDIVFHADRILQGGPKPRALRAMVVPTCNLMDVTAQLVSELNKPEPRQMREKWAELDRNTYRDASKRLRKKHVSGPVRIARNKLGAHLDTDVYEANPQIDLNDMLRAIGDSLMLLLLSLNHESHAFAWIRSLGSSPDGVQHFVETMFSYPVVVRWMTDKGGRILDARFMQLGSDPRNEIQNELLATGAVYNKLTELDGVTSPPMRIKLHDRPMALPDKVKLAGPLG